ncbi:hypothetical protein VQH23_16395 [Pararoseomonas sp. SCSIO 73927]|uniref:hypothetical protein n=1 Tax=Pararoseomonas sp. SCSIO 73927 TaxID=3114537 RepID=UPI0030CC83E4
MTEQERALLQRMAHELLAALEREQERHPGKSPTSADLAELRKSMIEAGLLVGHITT